MISEVWKDVGLACFIGEIGKIEVAGVGGLDASSVGELDMDWL